MDDDQQFCLRWNNHQSTLISVFDTLLENGTLVDCTLAAEGKFLKAHKVVLSACSPYFAALLSQQYDKHPIFILKDVKFQELRAMMDYMYRGEVNISQDQLAALLKAAESLQIKGLSDSRGGSASSQKSEATTSKTLQPQVPVNKASGLTIENKRPLKSLGTDLLDTDISGSREGSTSPTSRKRKKIRRKSLESNNLIDNHDQHSNSSSQSLQTHAVTSLANQSSTSVAITNNNATSLSVPSSNVANIKKTENIHQHQQQQQSDVLKHMKHQQPDDVDDDGNDEDDENMNNSDTENEQEGQPRLKDMKSLNQSELMIEPKNEYDDGNDENVEDLTLDDEELLDEMDQPGPSHGGEGSSQGYAQWQMERAQDEAFMGQEGGQHRDAQDLWSDYFSFGSLTDEIYGQSSNQMSQSRFMARKNGQNFPCLKCGKWYSTRSIMLRHMNHECGVEKKIQCSFCYKKFRRKWNLEQHVKRLHHNKNKNNCEPIDTN